MFGGDIGICCCVLGGWCMWGGAGPHGPPFFRRGVGVATPLLGLLPAGAGAGGGGAAGGAGAVRVVGARGAGARGGPVVGVPAGARVASAGVVRWLAPESLAPPHVLTARADVYCFGNLENIETIWSRTGWVNFIIVNN